MTTQAKTLAPARPAAARPLIAVYGAAGHTARFVIAELRRRGLAVRALARDVSKLDAALIANDEAIEVGIADAAALDRALAGCSVLIHCAGPFLDTARPLADAALRAGCHYIDVTAEQAAAAMILDEFDAPARAAGIAMLPAAGFYGGLADLLASALLADADAGPAHTLDTAITLSDWWPTAGTRITGERNRVPRVVRQDGRLVPLAQPAPASDWDFAAPFGRQAMVDLPFSEIMTLAHHLPVPNLRSRLNSASLEQIRNPATPAPAAADADGRSAQHFMMEVVATGAQGERRARAEGRDIYALSAQMVVEAAQRLVQGAPRAGAFALGQLFEPRGFLAALAPDHLTFEA
ncbi:NAD(P)H-binding protein [Aquabacterium humicola]|uniref:NAD(P)H-binding protein n=1 Tax=Aquabacterium humicola TaxID=3237377 RepID=UPI002543EA5B|nr:saccharopine dehydrogenase NADP-binding domain-containing protein [Rubrivivax pictus]